MTDQNTRKEKFEKQWNAFLESSGFKILALAGLSGRALAIVCYLINCELAGTGALLTSKRELGILLKLNTYDLEEGLSSLRSMGIVRLTHNRDERFLIEFVPDPSKWLGLVERVSQSGLRAPLEAGEGGSEEPNNLLPLFPHALRFPHIVDAQTGSVPSVEQAAGGDDTHESALGTGDLLELYMSFHPEQDAERESFFLDSLLQAHPPEHVRRMIEAFGSGLRSLGFLAGAWTHYAQKLAELDSHENAPHLGELRAEHKKMDDDVRRASRQFFEKASLDESQLKPSERVLLHVLEEHDNPRRQLYWALRIRHRYPALKKFFEEVASLAQPPPEPFRRGTKRKESDKVGPFQDDSDN